jgi:hypothetical protein
VEESADTTNRERQKEQMWTWTAPRFVVSALSSTLATSLDPIEERTTLRAILGTSLVALRVVRSSIGSSEVASVEESADTTNRERQKEQMWKQHRMSKCRKDRLKYLRGRQVIDGQTGNPVASIVGARTRNAPGATLHQQCDPLTRQRPCVGSFLTVPTPPVPSRRVAPGAFLVLASSTE